MMTIALIDNDRRPMAFDAFFEGMPSSDKLPAIIWQNYLQACRYAQGDLPPRYPVPSRIGTVDIAPSWVVVEAADEGFDPWSAYDLFNGRWPENSPNHPSKF